MFLPGLSLPWVLKKVCWHLPRQRWEGRRPILTWQAVSQTLQRGPRPHSLPGQVQVADDEAPAVPSLGELQEQGQALLPEARDPGGQEGGQQPARVGARHQQALVFLCKHRSVQHTTSS